MNAKTLTGLLLRSSKAPDYSEASALFVIGAMYFS